MDGSAFDRLTKTLTESRSRRGLSRLLGGLTVAGPLALLGVVEGEARKKKKVTLCHQGQTIKVSRKLKKKHLKHGDTLGKCPSCTRNCAGKTCGSDGCGGTCGDCLGGTCSDDTCLCPAERPELCGDQCRAVCAATQMRHPETCTCCVTFGNTCQQPSNCCSGICQGGTCGQVAPGAACSFDAQCGGARQCVSGMCSCRPTASYCQNTGIEDACVGGFNVCLYSTNGGIRCGSLTPLGSCGDCSSDAECQERYGSRAFCAGDEGDPCPCATGQRFCTACDDSPATFCQQATQRLCGPTPGPCGRQVDCGSCPPGPTPLCINGVCQD